MNIAAVIRLNRQYRPSANALRVLLGAANDPVRGSRILSSRWNLREIECGMGNEERRAGAYA